MSMRIKSIDFFRGLCIIWMMCGHFSEWWMYKSLFNAVNTDTWNIFYIFDFLGAAGFLFISGMGITISYKVKLIKSKQSNEFNFKKYRFEYFIKALLLLLIGLVYNLVESILVNDFSKIWIWFILQTLPFCILISWPFLNINKYYKIIIAIIFFIVNEIIWFYVKPYKNHYDTLGGILFYILYNNETLSPILQFFPIFIIGSFIGDIIYENVITPQNKNLSNSIFIKKTILPLISIGLVLVIISIFIYPEHPFPPYFYPRESSWIIYSIGALICLYSIFLAIERLDLIKIKSKYRFFYYFSYYSFTTFILHLSLKPLFFEKLGAIPFFLAVPSVILLLGLFLRVLHFTLGSHVSIKAQISRASSYLTNLYYYRMNKIRSKDIKK
ncbi:MAG: DUF1624 domain-containing protein [Candidatus Lokiarchaeota archaeon]|nr:DUF1624 domain-containing protein [Candidatus Lokiarchaeota archaeon]